MIRTMFGTPVTILSRAEHDGITWVTVCREDGDVQEYAACDLRADGGSIEVDEAVRRCMEAET